MVLHRLKNPSRLIFTFFLIMCQFPQKKSIIHSPDDALGTGSDRLQVLVSLQDGKLGVAHLDGVERVS